VPLIFNLCIGWRSVPLIFNLCTEWRSVPLIFNLYTGWRSERSLFPPKLCVHSYILGKHDVGLSGRNMLLNCY
jgi:hypothetical protein